MARKHMRRIKVNTHHRKPPMRKPKQESAPMPMPGRNEFSADEEQSMRQGMRGARGAPPPDDTDMGDADGDMPIAGGAPDMDADDDYAG
jgi:hypothetical protein